jgi:hypothetical protein
MTSLFSPCLKTFILDIWHKCWKLVRTIFVSSRSMCSRCWKWLSLFDSRAIVERCRHEIEKNFLCFLGNHLELVMHVRIILEMIGWCLHLLKIFLYAQQATDWFIQERETRTQLCSIAISFCWCNCLLAIAILLIFLELYTVVHILGIQQLYLSDIL